MDGGAAIPGLLRDLNERFVLEEIRRSAPISRAQLSRRTGISKPTVSLALRSLREAGLVREATVEPGPPHYGAVYFEAVPEIAAVIGFDVGARFLRGALSDLHGDVRARQDVETAGADVHSVVAAIVSLRDSLVQASGSAGERVDGVVVAVPGVVPSGGGPVSLAGDVPGLGDVDLQAELRERLGVAVTLENDIDLAAVGEHRRGVARGVDDFAFLSVGTGLGAGIVLGGAVHRGSNGAAGELDAVRSGREDDLDPCASAVSAYAAGLAATGSTTLTPPFDVRAIFGAARAGDEVAAAVVREEARRIALHIVPVSATLDVSLVVLGGGIGMNGDLLLEPVRALLAEWLAFPPRVESSGLGDAATLYGALAIGIGDALENVFAARRLISP